jgi:hypothetical protein
MTNYVTMDVFKRNIYKLRDVMIELVKKQDETTNLLFQYIVDLLKFQYPASAIIVESFPDPEMRKFVLDFFVGNNNYLIDILICFNDLKIQPKTREEFVEKYIPIQYAIILLVNQPGRTIQSIYGNPESQLPDFETLFENIREHGFGHLFEPIKFDLLNKNISIQDYIDMIWVMGFSDKMKANIANYEMLKKLLKDWKTAVNKWEDQNPNRNYRQLASSSFPPTDIPPPDVFFEQIIPHTRVEEIDEGGWDPI